MRSKAENVHHCISNIKVKIFLLRVILVDSTTIKVVSSRLNYYQGSFKTEHRNIIRVNCNNKIDKNSQ